MQENKLTEAQSLELITSMINDSRTRLARNPHCRLDRYANFWQVQATGSAKSDRSRNIDHLDSVRHFIPLDYGCRCFLPHTDLIPHNHNVWNRHHNDRIHHPQQGDQDMRYRSHGLFYTIPN